MDLSLPPVQRTDGDTSWFTHDRFGMFIHWGLYSLAARHEWLRHNERMPTEDHDRRYFGRFDPDLYDPARWAAAAAGAGMKYMVITAKHHEGFCLWDSAHTDYKATNTPAKRDLLRPMLEAFRAAGVRTGLYYSLLDWHHPHNVIDPHIGPYREHPERAAMNAGRDQRKYAQYMRDQVRELLTGYGDIDVMWFDFSYPKEDGSGKGRAEWESEALLKVVRELRPGIVLDDRLDLPHGWDLKTPEQLNPPTWPEHNGQRVVWESCQTFSGSWGYHRDEASWRGTDELIRTLIDCVSKGGNLLLNVGPTGRGEFDARALERLEGIGAWMRRHDRSVYGCTAAPTCMQPPTDVRYTFNPATRRLYVHLLAWPYKFVHLPGLLGKIAYAQLLHDASEVGLGMDAWHANQLGTAAQVQTLVLPQQRPDVAVPVIECWLAEG